MFKCRKSIRLDHKLYETEGQVFSITVCTLDKIKIFNNEPLAKHLFDITMSAHLRSKADLMAFCIMPDHVHLLIAPNSENLIGLIGRWKSFSSNSLVKIGYKNSIWQRSFYDHALRKEDDIEAVANYIINNPVRSGIVTKWQDHPFSWHKWM